jgi:hypothetical protein
MPTIKERQEYLTHQDRLRIKFLVEQGKVVEINLVQYEAEIQDKWWPIARYDMAHGFFHRDIMSPDGAVVEKQTVPYQKLSDALTLALDELHRQWQFYRHQFEGWLI